MADIDRWQGEINARVQSLEDRARSQDGRAGVLGDAINSLRVDMSRMDTKIDQLTQAVGQSTIEQKRFQEDAFNDLKQNLRQRRLTNIQILSVTVAPIFVAVMAYMIITAIAGTPGGH